MRKITLILFALLICMPLVLSAKAPTSHVGDYGLEIRTPPFDSIPKSTDYRFSFHVFNSLDGYPVNTGINCTFHLYNNTGVHVIELSDSTASPEYDYNIFVDGGNFTSKGTYSYIVQCFGNVTEYTVISGVQEALTVTRGGFSSRQFYITSLGEEISEAHSLGFLAMSLTMVLSLLGVMFLFAYLYSHTDSLNKFLKLLFLFASLLTGVLGLAFVNDLVEENSLLADLTSVTGGLEAYSMILWVFRVAVIAVLIWLIYATAMAMLGKKVDGPEEGERG